MEKPIAQPESPFEILRRMENMVRNGVVHAVRHTRPARCRVKTGGLITNWIHWWALMAGGTKRAHWWPPVVGEQCLLLCPGGDLLNAVALCGLYSDAMPQASENPDTCRTDWSDTDYMQHDSAGGHLLINCAGSITFQVQGTQLTLTPEGAFVTPDIVANQHVSLLNHVHGGVMPGTGSTGRPQ